MAATVFYLPEVPAAGEMVMLDGPAGRHAATVRRIGAGARLTLSDGAGVLAPAVVEEAGRDQLRLRILAREIVAAPAPYVTVVQALPKSDRSELAVELATEAGVDSIVPWQAARCVARWDGAKAVKGVQKWRAAAEAAAQQSRRAYIPVVAELANTSAVAGLVQGAVGAGAVAAVLHESADTHFTGLPLSAAPQVLLIVGPEGGIDEIELQRFTDVGALPVVLGPTVLRTSTAAAVALGAVGALTQRWLPFPP